MRVDIITLHAVKNYGSILQAFATQELFKAHGADARIINYVKNESRDENILNFWSGKNILKRVVIMPTAKRWKKVFGGFCKNYLNISGPIYTTEEDFRSFPIEADAYCTGSDQVWNSKWNNGILPMLYLNFVPDEKPKFSFSASFGQERLSDVEVVCTKKYIERYKYISVREESAKQIITKQYQYHAAQHLLDPTLCVTKEFWEAFAGPRIIKEDYILIYNLNRSKEFDDFAKKTNKKTNLKLVRLCMRYDQITRCGKSVIIPEVFGFVNLINNASFVLTDSFHATAFSMNMNTRPICVYPNEFGGRIDSFLKMTNSLQCHVKDYNDIDVLERDVDFNMVNSILNSERAKANDYISRVFKDINESILKE